MKDIVISLLGELVEELAKEDEQKKAWEDFLVDFAGVCEKANIVKEELKAPISNLLQHISEKELSDGVELLHAKIENFPIVDVYKVLTEVLGDMNREYQMRITELRDILAELATPIIRLEGMQRKTRVVPEGAAEKVVRDFAIREDDASVLIARGGIGL